MQRRKYTQARASVFASRARANIFIQGGAGEDTSKKKTGNDQRTNLQKEQERGTGLGKRGDRNTRGCSRGAF
jgi:hypothetical protein